MTEPKKVRRIVDTLLAVAQSEPKAYESEATGDARALVHLLNGRRLSKVGLFSECSRWASHFVTNFDETGIQVMYLLMARKLREMVTTLVAKALDQPQAIEVASPILDVFLASMGAISQQEADESVRQYLNELWGSDWTIEDAQAIAPHLLEV